MKSISTLKNEAKEALRGNWGSAAIVSVLVFFVLGCTSAAPGIGYFFLALPIEFGFITSFRKLLQGDALLVDNLFSSSFENYLHKVGTGVLRWVYVFLFTLLLIIPGIIKSLSYEMVPFLIEDNPDLSAEDTLRLSSDMMRGHKMDLFFLYLSFAGWWFLCLFTMGIGYFFLRPYVRTTVAAFYEDLKANYNADSYQR
ncbi:MAG: DUF975 family protein [Bacteroidales bacterium]|jgi:uncharacterized membrane protein|nr:DUF975 family protein [Bacteroidales bacterium]MBR6416685.1 DUF975 family protein [Bacteroidales bacterium]